MRFRGRRQRTKPVSRALADALADAEFKLKDDLIAARKDAELDQVHVAEEMGVDKSTISRFERLDSNPTLSMLRNYAYEVGAVVTYRVEPIDEYLDRQHVDHFVLAETPIAASAVVAGLPWWARRLLPGLFMEGVHGQDRSHEAFWLMNTAAPETAVTTIQDLHI